MQEGPARRDRSFADDVELCQLGLIGLAMEGAVTELVSVRPAGLAGPTGRTARLPVRGHTARVGAGGAVDSLAGHYLAQL